MSHSTADHPFDAPEPDQSFLSNNQQAYCATRARHADATQQAYCARRVDALDLIPDDPMLMAPYGYRLERAGIDLPMSLPRLDELIDKAILTSSLGALRSWIKKACEHKRAPVLELILHRVSNMATPLMLTPEFLHDCARNDFFEGARALIGHGANPLGRNERGQTPLMSAIENKSQRCALYFASLGGLDLQDAQGHTPLHFACASSSTPEYWTELLLMAGANPNVADWTGSTPAHYAAKMKSTECIMLLSRFKGSVGQENYVGETPMHLAATLHAINLEEQHSSKNTLDCLAKLGLDPNAQTHEGLTVAMNAARYGNLAGLVALSNMGAHLGAQDSMGKTMNDYAKICHHGAVDWTDQVQALSDRWILNQHAKTPELSGNKQTPRL